MKTIKHNSSNASKNPYMRDDLWAAGYFDFLFKPNITPAYRARLEAIKTEAQQSNRYISDRIHFEKMGVRARK